MQLFREPKLSENTTVSADIVGSLKMGNGGDDRNGLKLWSWH
jgi:hypothetical protein